MDNSLNHYMVDFTLPGEYTEEFVALISRQRATVNRLLSEGKILNYALSLENAKLWAVFSARSEAELHELVERLPLSKFMQYQVFDLTFFNASHPFTPVFSVN